MKGKCDVDFTRHPSERAKDEGGRRRRHRRHIIKMGAGAIGGGDRGGGVNFGVVDNFPYPPFVTHSTLTSPAEEGRKKGKFDPSFPPSHPPNSEVRSCAIRPWEQLEHTS